MQEDLLKRGFDLFFSLLLLLLSSPLLATICLLIKLSSKGPIFYGQKRVGKRGKNFLCWKFRTMYVNADEILHELLKRDPLLRKEWRANWKLKNDPRVTPLGKFLRKTSLDEFPQFWNVLKGDLSIVGPRPCVEEEIALYFKTKASKILSMRPGITGLWQTSGRNNLSYQERIELDEKYIDSHCFISDLLLIIKTIGVVFSSKGAY